MKELVRKSMKEVGLPIDFWNYYVESRDISQNLKVKNYFQLNSSNLYAALKGEKDMSLTCATMDSDVDVTMEKM